jgi:hypothetical protein
MMHRRRSTWDTGKVFGAKDLEGFRIRFGEYQRGSSINGPRSTIHMIEPIKSRERISPSSSAQRRWEGKEENGS